MGVAVAFWLCLSILAILAIMAILAIFPGPSIPHRTSSEENMARNQSVNPSGPGHFADEARRRWLQLKDELTTDVAEFNVHQSGAEFSQPSSNQFVVNNSLSGVSLTLTAD